MLDALAAECWGFVNANHSVMGGQLGLGKFDRGDINRSGRGVWGVVNASGGNQGGDLTVLIQRGYQIAWVAKAVIFNVAFWSLGEPRAVMALSKHDFGWLISAKRELMLFALSDLKEMQVVCQGGLGLTVDLGFFLCWWRYTSECSWLEVVTVDRHHTREWVRCHDGMGAAAAPK
jgi:hypothetical protein